MFQKFCRGAFQIFAPLLAVVALGVESRAGQLSLRWTDTASDEAARPHSRIVREFHRVPHPLGSRGVAERVVPVEAPDPRPAGLEAVGRLRIQPTGLHRLQVMRQQTDTAGAHSANGSLNEPFRIA